MTIKRALTCIIAAVFLPALSTSCPPLFAQSISLLKQVYVRTPSTLTVHKDSCRISGFARKGEKALVVRPALCFMFDKNTGGEYLVRLKNGTSGYIPSEYCCDTQEEALARYESGTYDPLHSAAKDRFHGGDPLGCDYFPREKPVFKDNVMPRACYCMYLPASASILGNIDEYIALALRTKINCFIMDIKEDGLPGFKADAMRRYAPSAYRRAQDNASLYETAVRKCHENGIWCVARIVTFKDYHFTKDHPECALWDKRSGAMLYHNKSNWPSAYCRLVWEYNVSLAREAVRRFGFNEVNFDYVRFPDRMNSIEESIEMRNTYGESKVQAIQRFVQYACDQLHKDGVYVSIDVFGESANAGYTTAYGQYWPAISNVADVICGMPYPDHFSNGYYGIDKPWNHPYEILHAWGTRAQNRQAETPTPAVVRTWVQAYHVMKHVDKNGIDYNAPNIEKEVRGLYDAGCTGGYATWLSSGSLNRYREISPAFTIDYYSDWLASGRTGN